jgi:16S rRNA (guanine527-N7)-methyltransferase
MLKSTANPLFNKSPSEVKRRLVAYVELLDRWRNVTNLISGSSFEVIWTRHVEDCLQLSYLAPSALHWLDIGSGAGLPGLIVAIQLANVSGALIECVESDARKCAFLREVVRTLDLPARVHNQRAELLLPSIIGRVDAVTARAFASLPQILELSNPYLDAGALALLQRGKTTARELQALNTNSYSIETLPGATDKEGFVLRVRKRI